MTRTMAAVVIALCVLLGYAACNRIVDLTPDAASNASPDAALGVDDDAASTIPDAAIGGGLDGPDASFPDASPDAI